MRVANFLVSGFPNTDAKANMIRTILDKPDAKVVGMCPHAVSANILDAVNLVGTILLATQFDGESSHK
jgi:hypothetical protein